MHRTKLSYRDKRTLSRLHHTVPQAKGVHPKIVQERLGHSSIQITLDTYSHVAPGLQQAAANRFDDIVLPKPDTERKKETIEKKELASRLAECITDLPENQRQVIILYYQQELTMKEASLVLNVTESRVSQLHASAIFSLSSQLKEYDDGR